MPSLADRTSCFAVATKLALAGAVVLALALAVPETSEGAARVTLTPASGGAGTKVSLRGAGFGPGKRVSVRAGSRTLVRTRASRRGSFAASLRIPARRSRSLILSSRAGARRVVNVFRYSTTVGEASWSEVADPKGRRLRWSPGRAPAGGRLSVEAFGLPALRRARLAFDGTSLATIGTSRRGSLRVTLEIPTAAVGVHRVSLGAGRVKLTFPFAVALDPVVAAVGDIACDPASSSFNGGAGSSGSCRQRYTAALAHGLGPAAVLALGDLQYEDATLAKFQASYEPSWGRLRSITYPVAGNHEYLTAGAAGYFDYFNGIGQARGRAGERGKGYYSFDVGTWHLIALNSNCSEVGGCGAGSAQERWLRADLVAHPRRCTLAYWHHPRFASGQYRDDPDYRPLWQALYERGAEIVLNGHDHNYQRYALLDPDGRPDPRGLREFVVGSGGKNHIPVQPGGIANREAANDTTYGVLLLTLRPSGYEWRLAPEGGGAPIDPGSGACH